MAGSPGVRWCWSRGGARGLEAWLMDIAPPGGLAGSVPILASEVVSGTPTAQSSHHRLGHMPYMAWGPLLTLETTAPRPSGVAEASLLPGSRWQPAGVQRVQHPWAQGGPGRPWSLCSVVEG